MHIKRIHDMVETLTEVAKCELAKGIECVDTNEMGEVTDMIKDLCEAEYYATITKAMDESEYGEDYNYMGAYDEHERKGYRGQPRDAMGRYTSRRGRRGGRMGYEEPPYYHMTPEMYKEHEPEYWRDMDRETMGRMYYDGMMTNVSPTGMMTRTDGMRDAREGRAGMKRKGYMESKEMGKEKAEKMKNLEEYMKELSMDVTEMISDASPEEKSMLKSKMQTLLQKIQ